MAATAHMYDLQSKFDELKKVQDRLLFLLLDLGFSPGQAEVYANRGDLDLVRTDQRKSELAAQLEEALGRGNVGVATSILRRLAFIHSQKGEFKEALARLEEWLKLLEPKDTYNRSLALADVGRLERLLGRPEAALQHSDEAVVLFRRRNDRFGEAYSLIWVAQASWYLLRFEDALDAYSKAADIYRSLGVQRQAALSYSGAGDIASMLGNPDKGLELKKMGLELVRKTNDLGLEADYLCSPSVSI